MYKIPKYLRTKIPESVNNYSNAFTLVEILVAIVILTLGILAVSQMTVMGMRTSRVINRQMYARDVLNRQFEFLAGLPTNDTTYLKHRTSVTLDDTAAGLADYRILTTTKGGVFRLIWNVAENRIDTIPDPRFKTVRLHVIGQGGKPWLKSNLLKLK